MNTLITPASSAVAPDAALPVMTGRSPREFKPKQKLGPIGLAMMVLLHVGLGYALVSGLGGKVVQLVKKPLTATLIKEVKLEPPPPPLPPKPLPKTEPPKVEVPPPAYVPPAQVARTDAPSPLSTVQSTEPVAPPPAAPAPVAAAPAAPAPPPQPVVPKVVTADMKVACPKQVRPEPPEKAVDEGISGTVKVEVRIKAGKVTEVKILSGPRVYYSAVRTAISQYECLSSVDEIIARQDFEFKVE